MEHGHVKVPEFGTHVQKNEKVHQRVQTVHGVKGGEKSDKEILVQTGHFELFDEDHHESDDHTRDGKDNKRNGDEDDHLNQLLVPARQRGTAVRDLVTPLNCSCK
ncbi:FMRFamide receptor [Biomphalaria pfeifferi]|uniref:FMRFamide receptor n=1 Tax=Biomphalaria pfeifferi TaxID=112525 RepID=A0AAD8B447_BIOPF|nr:FMRFamide receptor [Biomphalaria pfeifferi]